MRTLQNELSKWSKKNGSMVSANNENLKPIKKKEKLSKRDLEELMGIYRPRHSRGLGGAFKQR
ncbi:hypothetical protein [Metabacillus sp. 22489]|uniref:hypothetical protein n=1 Tax=Metabacillus sp. 22489 TaxID=3453928 RepID=UPI003F864F78